ncbi:hypothetical protein Ocin01_09873 [Orchesella cincta]|uniref:CYTH domain-containing protein n=1 Tax=Orchesella cincta TaxID=48709 RepID=A0A1D2MVX2_ORCCI|nr:hypothetical protein Ocin01_09873 [Orchesella cincta]
MPGNIEIKAKITNLSELTERAKAISEEHIPLQQCDTFFNAPTTGCRLKLRCEEKLLVGEKSACLVAYNRPDVTGPKFSHYVLSPVSDPATMEEALTMSNGAIGKVEKKRDAFIVKRNGLTARVHLDNVKGLGEFLEFEVIVENDSQLPEANSIAEYLSTYFGISDEDRIPGAYWNLLQAKKTDN